MDSQTYTESTIISHNIYEVGALNRRRTDRQTTPIPPPNKKGGQVESTKHRRQLNNRKRKGLGNSDDNDGSEEDDDQDPRNNHDDQDPRNNHDDQDPRNNYDDQVPRTNDVFGTGSGVDDYDFNHYTYTTNPIKDSAFERYGDINDHTTAGKYDMRTYNEETIAAIYVSQVTPQAGKLPSSDRKEHPVDIQPETPLCLDDDSSPFSDDEGESQVEASRTYGIESLSKDSTSLSKDSTSVSKDSTSVSKDSTSPSKDSTSLSKDSTSLSRVPRHFVRPSLHSLLHQSRHKK